MTRNVYNKNIRRTISEVWEEYIAIMVIIALGVGFLRCKEYRRGP